MVSCWLDSATNSVSNREVARKAAKAIFQQKWPICLFFQSYMRNAQLQNIHSSRISVITSCGTHYTTQITAMSLFINLTCAVHATAEMQATPDQLKSRCDRFTQRKYACSYAHALDEYFLATTPCNTPTHSLNTEWRPACE